MTSTDRANNISLTTVSTSGTFNFGSGALSGATTSAFRITGGAGSFAYPGTITNTAAGSFTVQDQNRTGGALSLTGVTRRPVEESTSMEPAAPRVRWR